ncbi:MAG TPA: transposase [Acidimicrobiales bacterium]|nr:transposase [Acidimicrobiales bacterium]
MHGLNEDRWGGNTAVDKDEREAFGPALDVSDTDYQSSGLPHRSSESGVLALRTLIASSIAEITWRRGRTTLWLEADLGYVAIKQIVDVRPILAVDFVAEIGDVTHSGLPEALSFWAGLTPRHRESDTKVTLLV